MEHGIIKFFLRDRHFGFITYGEKKDVFFHGGDFEGEVTPGVRVTFDIAHSERGLRATNVRPAVDSAIERRSGRVKAINRRYGFIDFVGDAGEHRNIFFHFDGIVAAPDGARYEPVAGCLVTFETGERWGQAVALKVEIVSWPSPSVEQIFAAAGELV